MKKILSVLFAIMMLFSIFFCLPVGAVNSATTDEAMDIIGNTSESDKIRENVFSGEYETGAVIVGLKKDAPPIETLLSGFNITESKLITPGSAGDNIYYVKFVEETEEIVWKAIAVLSQSPYVKYAEPNYYAYVEPPVEPSTSETQTQPTTEIIATTSGNPKSSTSDTPETNNSATSDTVKTVNSNGTVQTGQNNSVMILTLLLIISAAATAVFIKFRYRD